MAVPCYQETEDPLDVLATHCIAARAVIDESGSSVMRRLIDMLLYEIGVALAERDEKDAPRLLAQ